MMSSEGEGREHVETKDKRDSAIQDISGEVQPRVSKKRTAERKKVKNGIEGNLRKIDITLSRHEKRLQEFLRYTKQFNRLAKKVDHIDELNKQIRILKKRLVRIERNLSKVKVKSKDK